MTEKENQVYQEIIIYYKENKYLPSIRELQKKLNYKSTNSIYRIINSLEKKGYLNRENKKRKIVLSDYYNLYKENGVNLCVINTKETLILKLDKTKNYLGFKIRNNYFNDIFIKKNDYLIIEKTNKLSNGDLGLFIVCDKYRIMKYFYQDGFYILTDNKQEVMYKVKILGKVIGVYRTTI